MNKPKKHKCKKWCWDRIKDSPVCVECSDMLVEREIIDRLNAPKVKTNAALHLLSKINRNAHAIMMPLEYWRELHTIVRIRKGK